MRTIRNKTILSTLMLLIFLIISGCHSVENSGVEANEVEIEDEQETKDDVEIDIDEIIKYDGEPSAIVDQIYTTDTVMSLTFNGIVEDHKMNSLLEKLADHDLNATFFLTKEQLVENEEVIETIIAQGHNIENSVYNQQDLKNVDYKDIYKDVMTVNAIIEDITGEKPHFTRTKPWKSNHDLQLITAQLNMDGVIGHSTRPRDKDLESKKSLAHYFEHALLRGGVISLDTKDYPHVLDAIDYIVEEAKYLDYAMIPLTRLV